VFRRVASCAWTRCCERERTAGRGKAPLSVLDDRIARTTLAGRRWLILALVILAGMLNYVDRQAIAVLKPVISADLHWTDSDYGRLASIFQLAAAAGYLFAGRLVDRLGVRWANPLGVATWSLAAMAHGWARTFLQFMLARIALGFTESMGTPSGIKTVSVLFPADRRAAAIGLMNAAGNIGAIATPLVIPLIALPLGWRAAFVAIGAAGLAWLLLWIPAVAGLSAPRVASTAAPEPRSILRDRRTWAIAGAKALSDQVWWLLLFWTPDFLHRVFGLGLGQLAAPLALIYGCAAVGSIAGGAASTALVRRGVGVVSARKSVLLVCALLVTPAPLALTTHQMWVAAGPIGLLLAAHQGFSVNLFALVGDVVPQDAVGRVTAFGSLCGNLSGMAVVYLAGETLVRGVGYGPLLAIAAVSYLLALGWLQLWLPPVAGMGPRGEGTR
jgi:ACS family hexuronate transporter-like MFS transporter